MAELGQGLDARRLERVRRVEGARGRTGRRRRLKAREELPMMGGGAWGAPLSGLLRESA
ncbi:hypothetical protein JR065_06105 [Xanthomonas sp. AmX2]|uniref:hypothetical protein n=1 Tax=Xanthomonas sp. TaxID=29446 RepID=UPI0019812483|nr:hypothetical protein [Xanthomonas sp.]MBN6149905.1 hypothetical protein [Xanthomonas sp.]